jgi:hypothetical protein
MPALGESQCRWDLLGALPTVPDRRWRSHPHVKSHNVRGTEPGNRSRAWAPFALARYARVSAAISIQTAGSPRSPPSHASPRRAHAASARQESPIVSTLGHTHDCAIAQISDGEVSALWASRGVGMVVGLTSVTLRAPREAAKNRRPITETRLPKG